MSQTSINVKQVELDPEGWRFNILSRRIATITAPDGTRKVSYFGFDSQEEAEAFRDALVKKKLCTSALVRASERLATPRECKAWGVSTELICYLINRSNRDDPTTGVVGFTVSN